MAALYYTSKHRIAYTTTEKKTVIKFPTNATSSSNYNFQFSQMKEVEAIKLFFTYETDI